MGHLDEGETLQKYLIRNKYSISIAVSEAGPFTVRSTYVRAVTNCSSAVNTSTSELGTPLYTGQTTVASYTVPVSIPTFVRTKVGIEIGTGYETKTAGAQWYPL